MLVGDQYHPATVEEVDVSVFFVTFRLMFVFFPRDTKITISIYIC